MAHWLRQVKTFSTVRLCGIVLAPSTVHFVDVFSCYDKETHSGTVCYTSSLLDMLVFVLLNGIQGIFWPLWALISEYIWLFYSGKSCFQGSARIWALNACCTLTVKRWIKSFSVTGSNYMDCLTGAPCTRLLIFKIRQRCLSDISHSFCDDANKKKFNSRCVQWWANASVTCGNGGDMRDLNAFCLNMDSPLRTVYLIVPVILGQLWSYGRQC